MLQYQLFTSVVAGAGTVNSAYINVGNDVKLAETQKGIYLVVVDDNPAGANGDVTLSLWGTAVGETDDYDLTRSINNAGPARNGLNENAAWTQMTGSSKYTFACEVYLMPKMRARSVNVVSGTNVINAYLII